MGSRPVNILLTPGTGMLILPQETTITTNFRISRSCAMMSTIPADLSKLSKENLNQELLRIGIIAELDAINLY